MEHRNYAKELHLQLQQLEKQITDFEQDCARTENSGKTGRGNPSDSPARPSSAQRQWTRPDKLRDLLLSLKEGSGADIAETLLREGDLPALKQEINDAKHYISMLKDMLREPSEESGLRTDLPLTAEEDRAHNQLEAERREFKRHYDALEHDFESREKELMDELRDLGERATKQELELAHLRLDLENTRERMDAAESKASSISLEMMEMNVFNRSSSAAIKEKDLEISDLRQALQEALNGAKRTGPRP